MHDQAASIGGGHPLSAKESSMKKGLRQGDVLLVPVATVRGERIEPVKRRYLVAEGELTGHHHSIVAGPKVAAFLSRDGLFFDGRSSLVHQEHTPHDIDGAYKAVVQRRASDSDHQVMRSVD
jgi:hypothetical protein